jgi:hypothetical protein
MTTRKRKKKIRRSAFQRGSRVHRRGDAHTIPSFCVSNRISESLYYKLKRQGKGAREIEVGDRILITEEAEADWRREREAETTAKRKAKAKAASRQSAEDTATV